MTRPFQGLTPLALKLLREAVDEKYDRSTNPAHRNLLTDLSDDLEREMHR